METETRAVSAKHGWLTPLVVLVPSVATVVGAVVALVHTREFAIPVLVVVGGVAITALVGSRTYGAPIVFGTAVVTLGAGVVGAGILALADLTLALSCANAISGGWVSLAVASGSLVYLAVGTVGFRTKYPLAGVAAAVILGVIALFIVSAGAPTPSIPDCES